MNKVLLIGRLTADPSVRYTQEGMAIARFTLAVDRIKEGTDFPSCNAFGKTAEFVEKYFKKGMKVALEGRLQTGSYTNKDNVKVYTTDVIAEHVEFCEKKEGNSVPAPADIPEGNFMDIPDGLESELPFN